jgi:hypothetical protein
MKIPNTIPCVSEKQKLKTELNFCRLPPWILSNTRLALKRKANLAKTVEDLDSR